MRTAIVIDCEFICREGSQRRFWCAVDDPDPVVAQIGAVKLGLADDFPILDEFMTYVVPRDRFGGRFDIDPFFTRLTGVSEEKVNEHGIALAEALDQLDSFSEGATLWSWGKDELNLVAIGCYVEGIAQTIPATRFDNAVKLLLAAGMPFEDLVKTPSNRLADYYGVDHPPLKGHDARDDAPSVAYTLQHLLRSGALKTEAFSTRLQASR